MRRNGAEPSHHLTHAQTALRRLLLTAVGFGAIPFEAAAELTCDGTEQVCVALSSSAEVEASGGVIAGGSFEDGGFRPDDGGGIDWFFGPEADFSSGRASFEVTGLLPTTGGELEGGKTAIFTGEGVDGGVTHFMKLQKMLEELLEGHLLRWGYDDDFLEDGFDALIVSSGVFPCGLFQLTDWTEDETHYFEIGWAPDGVWITVDDWSCSSGSNGDAFDPADKQFTLGNQVSHPPNQHADAVFRNFRLWADGPGEQPPVAVIEGITPTPTRRAAGAVSFMGFARDADPNGQSIVEQRWTSSRNGLLGTSESLIVDALDLDVGLHTITFAARDDEDHWTSDEATVLVAEGEPGTFTIELPARDDARVATGAKGDPNANYGDTEQLLAGADSPGAYDEASFLRFAVDEVPGTVVEATLHLSCLNSGGAQQVFATTGELRTGGPWTEENLTWADAPTPVGGALDAVLAVTAGERYAFDVTDGVVSGEPLELVIVSGAPDGGGYHSKEHRTPYEHPVLELRYQVTERRVFADDFELGTLERWSEQPP